jgi:hypothetical protein
MPGIEKQHIGLGLLHDLEHIGPIPRFADDFKIIFEAQQLPKTVAKNRVIISDHKADGSSARGASVLGLVLDR